MSSNRIVWLGPDDPPEAFPPLNSALREPDGLLAAGGDLSSERLLYAYRHGIFPWFDDGQPILWWSPEPRCVMRPKDLHIARRVKRQYNSSDLVVTVNRAFDDVIRACALPRPSQEGTWITDDMIAAYAELHQLGWAHSVEVRDRERLIGGIYGIAIGRVFFGESMFSAASNASKLALAGLCRILIEAGFDLIDCQVISGHLLTLGAHTVPRADFAAELDVACEPRKAFKDWPQDPISVPELLFD